MSLGSNMVMPDADSEMDHTYGAVSVMSSPTAARPSSTQPLLPPPNVVINIPLGVTKAFEQLGLSAPTSPGFDLDFSHDYAFLIPRFYSPSFEDRYNWLWKWEVGQDDCDYRSWKTALKLAKPVLDDTCYKHLNRPYGVNHAVIAGLFDEQLLREPVAGRVIFISGLLSGPKKFGKYDNYLPSPAALLRWTQEAGVASHLVVYHTTGLRPYGNIGNSANLFLCCPRHTDEAIFRLTRQSSVRPFREGTTLFIGRSDKAFSTTLCDEQGRQSGLTVAEVQLAQLLALHKAKAVNQALVEYESAQKTTAGNYKVLGKYLPQAFEVRDDEWVCV
ncbi:hypothetical protein FOZ60_006562 [Perkinsus olseni]|uniref:Uncharacterized protein n=1 Tax=Perkinsus olseni TaxID=32597 RepID=A0A7J6NP47_PEROL|nr:hypothetical protein FOZ60_006562 [Perkinsus olseni]